MPHINNARHISSYTKLPVREIVKAGYSRTSLEVTTPHKGKVFVEIKKQHSPFFGGDTETEKTTEEIIKELLALEVEAMEFLLNKWIKENDEKESR